LEINAPSLTTVEEARKKILNALYKLDFFEKYKDLALKLLIAQVAGSNTSMPQDSEFGKFVIQNVGTDLNLGSNNIVTANALAPTILTDWGDVGKVFVLKDDSQTLYRSLQAAGVPVHTFKKELTGPTYENYTIVAENSVGLSKYSSKKTDSSTVYDISELINVSQENLLLGEIPLDKIQTLAIVLRDIMVSADMYMSEDTRSELLRGNLQGMPLAKEEIRKQLYDLPMEPRLLRTFQNYLTNTAAYYYFPNLVNRG
ncbi:MAG: hypothetical protein ACKO96_09090, partial [Flammeovirgaceae bacterium]